MTIFEVIKRIEVNDSEAHSRIYKKSIRFLLLKKPAYQFYGWAIWHGEGKFNRYVEWTQWHGKQKKAYFILLTPENSIYEKG